MEHGLNFFFSILGRFGWLGNWLFLFFALLECIPFVGSFFPGTTLIIISGFLASQGSFRVRDIIIFATIGSFIGDYAGYLLGRYGNAWVRRLVGKNLMDKGENFFKKYGNKSVFWGRFINATRAVVPFIAGAARMRQRSFLLRNIFSSLIWSALCIFFGYFSGSVIVIITKKILHKPLLITALLALAILIYWLVKRHGQNMKTYYQKQYQRFIAGLTSNRWFLSLEKHYPVVSETTGTAENSRKIFNIFLGIVILLIIYVLVTVLDLL